MTIENDPPISGTQNSGRSNAPQDDDFDDVVFDDTSAAPMSAGRKESPVAKYGLAAVLVLLAAGGAFYFMSGDDSLSPPAPMTTQTDQPLTADAIDESDSMMQADNELGMPDPTMGEGFMSDLPPPPEFDAAEAGADDMFDDMAEAGIADPEVTETVEDIDLESLGVNTVPGTDADQELEVTEVETSEDLEDDQSMVVEPIDPEDAEASLPELTAEDAMVTQPETQDLQQMQQMPNAEAQSQAEIDEALQEELIRSLMADSTPSPDDAASTEQMLVNNTGQFDGQSLAGPSGPPLSPAESLRDIETEAMIRPNPQNFYVVRQESAPAAQDSLRAAKRALHSGNNARALSLFDQAYENSPNDLSAQMGRAVALQRMNRPNEALAAYEQVLRDNPENLEALTNMIGLLTSENPAYAAEKLVRLQQRYPNHAGVTVQLALAKADTGEVGEALSLMHSAYARDQGNAAIAYNLAVIYDRAGDQVNAATYYRQAMARERMRKGEPSIPMAAIQQRLSMFR